MFFSFGVYSINFKMSSAIVSSVSWHHFQDSDMKKRLQLHSNYVFYFSDYVFYFSIAELNPLYFSKKFSGYKPVPPIFMVNKTG